MKSQILIFILTTALIMGCASDNPGATSVSVNFSGVGDMNNAEGFFAAENEWKLIEVYINGEDTLFRRDTLPKGTENFFTLTFDAEHLSGVGAPNRYSAPYTKDENHALSVKLIRSTMMALLNEPENLNEHEFFISLQNAYAWKEINNTLELHSKTKDGREVKLVFSL